MEATAKHVPRSRAAARVPRWSMASRAAAVLVLAASFIAVASPWLAPFDPQAISDAGLQAPDAKHWLGTDQLGRDVFSRVMHGTRVSLGIAVSSVAFALVVGGAIGLLTGYFGGRLDLLIGRVLDVMFAVPEVLLALVVMSIVGVGLMQITLAIAVVYTPIFARVCRGSVLAARQQPFVEAARAVGASHARLMLCHVLPAAIPALVVQTTLSLAFAVLAESALSFLGLAGQTDAASWGQMLRQGKDMMERAWWTAVFPGLAITLLVLSFNVLGDGLRDVLDPRDA
jgi:peptide/nickel transport system permease protein